MLRTTFFQIADERGIRYTFLAKKMGYTKEYLSRIKAGTFPITEEFQRRAAAAFPDVAPEVLFFESIDEHDHHSMNSGETDAEGVPT